MKIDETTYKKMPPELQALFVKCFNSDEVLAEFAKAGMSKSNVRIPPKVDVGDFEARQFNDYGAYRPKQYKVGHSDTGTAARFFYCAKASRAERDAGLEGMPDVPRFSGGIEGASIPLKGSPMPVGKNNHPTVKPLKLMEYLVKLVKMPEYNLIIDPFCGSGTTLLACQKLGIPCIGIDNDEKSCEIASKRCNSQNML